MDSLSGYRLCRLCTEGKKVIRKVIVKHSPKLSSWLLKTGQTPEEIPIHNPNCPELCKGDDPVIISPKEDVVYIIRGYVPLEQQAIPLEASSSGDSKEVFWFVDGELLGKIKSGERLFFEPRAGIHKVICTDEQGRSSTKIIKII